MSLPISGQRNYSGLSANLTWAFDGDLGDTVVQCSKVCTAFCLNDH
jgi:hypothetical protein